MAAVICAKYKIKTLMIDAGFAGTNTKYVNFLHEKKINVLCFTVMILNGTQGKKKAYRDISPIFVNLRKVEGNRK